MSARFMTTAEVADELRLSVQTIWNWGHAPDKPHWTKVGKFRRYPRADFEAWLKAQDTTTVVPLKGRARRSA